MNTLGAMVLSVVALSSLGGCDKLKSMAGKDADGGTSSSSGGGILSLLDSDFEGEITMLPTSKKKVGSPIVLSMKKPKYRTDITQGAGAPSTSIILDAPAKKATMLMHASKTAMVLDLDQLKTMAGQLSGTPGSAAPSTPNQPKSPPPTFTNTGKKDTVAGYACDIWKMTTSDGKTGDACMAEKITWVDLGAIGGFTSLGLFTSEANHFPLRFVGYDATGAEETRIEAQKVEKKKLDDALFITPADYKLMDMGAMMNGLMGGKPSAFPPPQPKQH